MKNFTTYPKIFWAMTRTEVILEGNQEVINHATASVIGGTFEPDVAEKIVAVLKQYQGPNTMIHSNINTLSTKLLDTVTVTELDEKVQKLMDMVDISP